jgi:archaellum biogenesis protein FlaJ (TadC family)
MSGFDDYTDLLRKLGKHKTSKGCLYLNNLTDVDVNILKKLIKRAYMDMKVKKPA